MEEYTLLFIADVHLGKLARWLRMLGFDTLYNNAFSNAELISIAEEQQRVLLSRNAAIGRYYPLLRTFLITQNDPVIQLKNVLQHFRLIQHIQPFSRCMVCNGTVGPVLKENIVTHLPEKTALYYHEFWQCVNCKRIYWKGPHFNRMIQFIQQIRQGTEE